LRIDAHQHFWIYDPQQHTWMSGPFQPLAIDYLPKDLRPLLDEMGFDGTIVVQAAQSERETTWLCELAAADDWIRGVVGWVDLRDQALEERLAHLAHPKLCGVRHILHDEPADDFMLQDAFRRGIGQLADHQLTYDLLIRPQHLSQALQLVREFPRQPFIIDHIAKPLIQDQVVSGWDKGMRQLAAEPNVTCKLSGMVTEANWQGWKPDDFPPYLERVLEMFGPERLMIGSDWPVCTLAGGYERTMSLVVDYLTKLSVTEQESVLGGTCSRVYLSS
jgi:L-fuconolactonase